MFIEGIGIDTLSRCLFCTGLSSPRASYAPFRGALEVKKKYNEKVSRRDLLSPRLTRDMGVVTTFLYLLVFLSCFCAGRSFVIQQTARLHGRGLTTSGSRPSWSHLRKASPSLLAASSSRRIYPTPRWVSMSTTDREVSTGGGTGTGVQTIVKERVKELTVPEEKEKLAKEQWWRVILHNDEIHTFDYVTQSITKVVKKLTMKKAYEVTMETHKAGKATVTLAWKSKAEGYCIQLQQCGLTASIAPDSNFKGGKDEGGEE